MKAPVTYQLPLRMPPNLADELTAASESTGISRSTICRMGIVRILEDLKETKVEAEMAKFRTNQLEA